MYDLMNLNMSGGWVLIEPTNPKNENIENGIAVQFAEKFNTIRTGIVVSSTKQYVNDKNAMIPITVTKGNKIWYDYNQGHKIRLNGKEYLALEEKLIYFFEE